jgi:short-subunit dehydrogenase
MSTTSGDTALITGASAGIGSVCSGRLAKCGYNLALVARDKSRRADQAQRLLSSTGPSGQKVAAYLNDKVDLTRVEAILRANSAITLLVNNAGIGSIAPLLNADVEKRSTAKGTANIETVVS